MLYLMAGRDKKRTSLLQLASLLAFLLLHRSSAQDASPLSRKEAILGRVTEFQKEMQALAENCEQEGESQPSKDGGQWSASRFLIEPYSIPGPVSWDLLPKSVKDDFTLEGTIPYVPFYFDEGTKAFDLSQHTWPDKMIKDMVAVADARKPDQGRLSQYGPQANDALFKAFTNHPVEGKSCLVIGSQYPWVEAILISFGAGSVTTVDFNPPTCTDPRIRIMGIPDLDNSTETFDAIVSYSSIEHDGLGRYGDPINPWGDVRRMEKIKKLVKPDGLLYLGVPIGTDSIQWNAHRVYGPIRWKLLTEGWEHLGTYGYHSLEELWKVDNYNNQPMNVLRPVQSDASP